VAWRSRGSYSVPPLVHQIWDDAVVENTCQVGTPAPTTLLCVVDVPVHVPQSKVAI
jgi:hypothetical protein